MSIVCRETKRRYRSEQHETGKVKKKIYTVFKTDTLAVIYTIARNRVL